MKKIILILVFVFTTTAIFAMENIQSKKMESGGEINCVQVAFDAEEIAGEEFSYEVFDAIVEACEKNKK